MGIERVLTNLTAHMDPRTSKIVAITIDVKDIGLLMDKNGLVVAKLGEMVVASPEKAEDVNVLLSKTGVILAAARASLVKDMLAN